MTHVLGAGMGGPVEASELDRLERFHRRRGSPTTFDLCPAADANATLLKLIGERGYRLKEFNHVVLREIRGDEHFESPPEWKVEPAKAGDSAAWGDAMLEGFMGPGRIPRISAS